MIDVALLGIIRRWHIREHIPLREISRRLGISRPPLKTYRALPPTIQSFRENSVQDFQNGVDEIASRPGRESFRGYVEKNARFAAHNIAVEILPGVIANPELNSLFYDAAWDVIDLSAARFDLLIGDCPIVKIEPIPGCILMVLPITPKLLLCLASSKILIVQTRKISTSQLVKIVNKSTVLRANQYVYSTGRLHTEFVKKHLQKISFGADRKLT